jgi:cell division protein FtsW (lipid II flippase)
MASLTFSGSPNFCMVLRYGVQTQDDINHGKKIVSGSNFKAAHNMALICCCPCFLSLVVNDHSSSFVVMLSVVVTIAFVERIHVKIIL